ncbi:hypothetical protein [Streptomyces sp. cg35]|uniref:hypothetical protein n=1 Tax=Streptomyces sp. cg35 TaxID=3421650 RepID=UPI003D17134A
MAAVVAAGVACEPVNGDLSPSTAASTTDQEATEELNRQHADVAWLSCSAVTDESSGSSASTPTSVEVNCTGKTRKGEDITVKGAVHEVVSGKCVRGDLTARVENKVWFHVYVLGNCTESSGSSTPPPDEYTPPPDDQWPSSSHDEKPPQDDDKPPQDDENPPSHEPEPGVTTTVTETETVTVEPPDSGHSQDQGK